MWRNAARPQLAAAAIDILPRRIAQLGEDAALVQRAGHLLAALPRRAAERHAVDRVEGNHVQHAVLAGEQPDDAVDLVLPVVHAFEQRPLVLDRVAGGSRIALAFGDQFFGRHVRRARKQLPAQFGLGGVQRERQRGPDALLQQPIEHARIAHGGEHQVLVAHIAHGAEQFDGFQHVVEVVRRFAHAHEHHLAHRPAHARERHLGNDLGAAHLPQQAVAARHAELAPDGAADLRRNAEAVTRQQHAFDGLAVRQRHQQPLGAIGARMDRVDARQPCQFGLDGRQGFHQRRREETRRQAPAAVARQRMGPQPQDPLLVAGARAGFPESSFQFVDSHAMRGL
ncbi:MAG: hypothetical protein ABT25_30115 [Variovorax sp. SCN 67-20]|nr:MAG: hypothetical protein ABT25_30115 [Variovorax sp. SCN 67-20]